MSGVTEWKRKDLTTIEDLSREDLEIIFRYAGEFKTTLDRTQKKLPTLRGKTIVNLFMEPSTRTRVAFEIAAKRLSADVVSISSDSSSLVKGETLRDTAENIQALNADLLVMRHSSPGSPLYLGRLMRIPVINAGDGAHEHPTQALLDCFTLLEHFNHSLEGKEITILGDILFSRVARSNIHAMIKLGAKVTVSGPATLVPKTFESMGVSVTQRIEEALEKADAVMLLRIQHERQTSTHFPSIGEYTSMFGLNRERERLLKKDALIMHPGPINRGVELDSYLADSGRSVILEQVTNGIVCRMAVLYLCASYAERLRRDANQ